MFYISCTWKLNVEIFMLKEGENSGFVVDVFIKEACCEVYIRVVEKMEDQIVITYGFSISM